MTDRPIPFVPEPIIIARSPSCGREPNRDARDDWERIIGSLYC